MKITNPLLKMKERKGKKEALEKKILKKITKRMADTRFKECPWCGVKPWIDIECYPNCSKYRIVMKTCDHLDSYMCVNDYEIHEIPKNPLIYPNPHRRVDVYWNGGTHPDGVTISDVAFEEFPLKSIENNKQTDKEKKLSKYGLYEGKSGKRYPNISGWAWAVNNYLRDDHP